MRRRSVLLNIIILFVIALSALPLAAEQSPTVPAWLISHVGEGPGQIAQPVLQRARALYLQKLSEGAVRNACYFAMDATRPNDLGRFYIVCESSQTFYAISAGHGAGRDLAGVADFANGRQCAKNFGNALDSELTAGGVYVTSEMKTSFKGYYRASGMQDVAFTRTFLQFEGEGETANARAREIGGHASVVLKGVCLRRESNSPYADRDGYVPFGKLVDYAGGRSNGCTSWSASDARQIFAMVENNPTTLYIYPDAEDIHAVARAVASGRSPASNGLYWNAVCLKEIHSPKYWSRETLEPIIARYKMDHPAPPPQPTPICTAQ
jgi:hypothetical protein